MTFVLHDSVREFWSRARPVLAADPARHSVPLLIAHRAVHADAPPTDFTVLATGGSDGVRGAALATAAPNRLLISAVPTAELTALTEAVRAAGVALSGAAGRVDGAWRFAEAWCAEDERPVVVGRLRLYRLGGLIPPHGVAGSARAAEPRDAELLASWWQAFAGETHQGGVTSQAAHTLVRSHLGGGGASTMWEVEGTPVSWAAFRGPVEASARIAPVYTPPEHRGHGYASAVAAAASATAVVAGADVLVLYTDRDDPVPNAIYRRLGYYPIGDEVVLDFCKPGDGPSAGD